VADDEILNEFLVEANEHLDNLDQTIVKLEQRPDDEDLLHQIFRSFHSIKGMAGFFGFSNLEQLAHVSENLLSKLRDGELKLTT
jgi:two-component system chemotaxis sensor kinase CheA